MKFTTKGPLANRITEIRKRNRLSVEQVSILLGEKTTERLEEFERGLKTPNLKTALKLAHIFNLPVRIMLDGYYDACRTEIRKEQLRLIATSRGKNEVILKNRASHFCTFEASMTSELVSDAAIAKARSHATALIRISAEKLGHI